MVFFSFDGTVSIGGGNAGISLSSALDELDDVEELLDAEELLDTEDLLDAEKLAEEFDRTGSESSELISSNSFISLIRFCDAIPSSLIFLFAANWILLLATVAASSSSVSAFIIRGRLVLFRFVHSVLCIDALM